MIAEAERGMLDTYLALRDGKAGANPVETIVPVELDKSDPVQAFISDSFDLLSDDAAIMFIVYANMILVQEDPVTVFHSFIAESYAGEIGDKMLKMLGDLDSGDFAKSPYASQQRAIAAVETDPGLIPVKRRKGIISGMPRPLYSSIHCIDDIRHERFEDAVNSYNDLRFPQLVDLDMSRLQARRCEGWPITAAPIDVKDPVTSKVPTLILQGAYDFPTPVYMGRRADRELESSIFVLIPQQGHGTWNNSQGCMGQIASDFVQDPDAEIDLSCIEARQTKWALP
jgi:pimeloyl-ACP methyl ester carboxylesterase